MEEKPVGMRGIKRRKAVEVGENRVKAAGVKGEVLGGEEQSSRYERRGEAARSTAEEKRSRLKQQALKEKRCEIETNKSRTDSQGCGSHSGPTRGLASILL